MCERNEDLRRKIISQGSVLSAEDKEIIKTNTRLKEVYNYRLWWKEGDPETYMVFVNTSDRAI